MNLPFSLFLWENVAIAISLGYVFFNARLHNFSWILGGFASFLYIIIFASNGLYASAMLSIFFLFLMGYGFYSWKRVEPNSTTVILKVSFLSVPARFFALAIGVVFSITIYYFCLFIFTKGVPVGDAIIAGFSLVAQYLAVKKKLEAWYGWFLVNMFAVYTYGAHALLGTAALYGVYLLFSVYGWWQWRQELQWGKS